MSELTPEEVAHRSRLCMAALGAAMVGDEQGVNEPLNELAELGWNALYGAVLAFGSAVQAVYKVEPGEPFRGVVVVDAVTGRRGSLEDLGLGPELNAAVRVFAAWSAGDQDMAVAIFNDAVERGAGHDLVCASLALASTLLNREYERRKAAGTLVPVAEVAWCRWELAHLPIGHACIGDGRGDGSPEDLVVPDGS